jgi:hypothetical protein
VKNQDSMGKTKFFFNTMPFSPMAVSGTWMYVGAPQKYRKMNLIPVLNRTSPRAHTESEIGRAWCFWEACKICSYSSKRNNINFLIFPHTSYPNCNQLIFGLKEF